MKFILLTHERELSKSSNTGQLVKQVLGDDVEIIVWKRKEQEPRLVHLFKTKQAALLFPDSLSREAKNISLNNERGRYSFCVILDSTWQEARKMFNRSQYLRDADKVSIQTSGVSEYSLRRNQIEGGLSTAECVMEVLLACGQINERNSLRNEFILFNET